ncbi:MAG TPA: DUF1552 domain-containing protein [Polyangiaceae bacterium]|nr:DUF1552 domain-containing protein [Polyangiaceae bacterium]
MKFGYQGPQLSRRLVFGGAATLLGLPFLESVLPRSARAQAQGAPVRMVCIFMPNGFDMATFRPKTVGPDYALPLMFAGLEDMKPHFSIVTGLANEPADPGGSGDHGSGTGAFITCARLNRSPTDIRNGISIDQVLAQARDKGRVLPSLQLGVDGGGDSGACDQDYSCAYSRNISWADEVTPLPKIIDPSQAFNQLFKGYDPQASSAEADRRRAYDKSVIDFVLADVDGLKPKLGSSDSKKLDQYLTGVRELEKGLTGPGAMPGCTPGMPPADGLEYPAHVTALFKLIELAFTCDATRIVTLMFGNAASPRSHPFLNISGEHHGTSHHGGSSGNIEKLVKIGAWELTQLGEFMRMLNKPDPTDPAGQTLLYNSAIFCSSDVSDGDAHNHDDKPIVLGGHGGGKLNAGQHVAYDIPAKQKVANLLVTMAQAAGVASPKLGDSTGVLPELLV